MTQVVPRFEQCVIDPMFPTQVRVDQDGYAIWLHDAAQLYRWLSGFDCRCMDYRSRCEVHSRHGANPQATDTKDH